MRLDRSEHARWAEAPESALAAPGAGYSSSAAWPVFRPPPPPNIPCCSPSRPIGARILANSPFDALRGRQWGRTTPELGSAGTVSISTTQSKHSRGRPAVHAVRPRGGPKIRGWTDGPKQGERARNERDSSCTRRGLLEKHRLKIKWRTGTQGEADGRDRWRAPGGAGRARQRGGRAQGGGGGLRRQIGRTGRREGDKLDGRDDEKWTS